MHFTNEEGSLMSELLTPDYMWFNGAVRPWGEAQVHVWSEVVLRAVSVFEGLRGYWSEQESRHYFVHLDKHLSRLADSSRVTRIPSNLTPADVIGALGDLISKLDYREDVYVRPTVYLERGRYSIDGSADDCGFFMPVFPSPRQETIRTGLTCQVSSWRRSDDTTAPPRVKAAANYYNLRLARLEATTNGYGEAILLNTSGQVAETGGASIFIVRNGVVSTPNLGSSILESITRSSAIQLLAETGVIVQERILERTELYLADEVFMTGTLCEITPVISIDGMFIGNSHPGPFTESLQQRYYNACQSANGDERGWLTAGPTLGR
jgi:branched-chain amino acid aminotransferase